MITLDFENEVALVDWAAARLGDDIAFGRNAHAIGVRRDGDLAAVVVFDRFSATNAEMSLISDGSKRWMHRESLYRIMAYPFIQLKLWRLTAFVGSRNEPAIRACRFLGFDPTPEGILVDAKPAEDVLIFRMFASECKWLPRARIRHAA